MAGLAFNPEYLVSGRSPAAPFPKIFNRIDRLMKDYFGGREAREIAPELQRGRVGRRKRLSLNAAVDERGGGASVIEAAKKVLKEAAKKPEKLAAEEPSPKAAKNDIP